MWQALGQPYDAAYCRFRQGEALLAIGEADDGHETPRSEPPRCRPGWEPAAGTLDRRRPEITSDFQMGCEAVASDHVPVPAELALGFGSCLLVDVDQAEPLSKSGNHSILSRRLQWK